MGALVLVIGLGSAALKRRTFVTPPLLSLDVSILHALVLERLLGIDRAAQEAQRNITYVKDTRDALARVERGEAQIGFIMHPIGPLT